MTVTTAVSVLEPLGGFEWNSGGNVMLARLNFEGVHMLVSEGEHGTPWDVGLYTLADVAICGRGELDALLHLDSAELLQLAQDLKDLPKGQRAAHFSGALYRQGDAA